MNNIIPKIHTHRKAVAQAIIAVSKPETIYAIQEKKLAKGDLFEMSRAAGLLAIKKTSDAIPDCHPMPIEFASIQSSIDGQQVVITVEVHTVYKTGVEVEAMHGAAITAITMYDMLKPIDKGVQISTIRLIEKEGGKSDYSDMLKEKIKCAVVVCSDSIHAGKKTDKAGLAIKEKLASCKLKDIEYEIIPDGIEPVQAALKKYVEQKARLIIFTGGTGLSSRDLTPEAIKPLLTREIPGITEAARSFGQMRTPYSMLSRGIAGTCGDALVLTLPGSTRGAAESMEALFPYLLHIFNVMKGTDHSKKTNP